MNKKNKLTWIVLIIVLILIGALYANAQQRKIVFPGYTSWFNLHTHIPDSVTWTITKAQLTGTKIGRNNQFHSSSGMPNLKRDYAGSGYDQGHNSPYDDNYYNAAAEYECFDYVNMFPQRHILNAQTWEALEDHCRQMALNYGSCRVKTSWTGTGGTIGADKVVVPLYCVKELWYNGRYEKYVMPNNDTVKRHPFTFYKLKNN